MFTSYVVPYFSSEANPPRGDISCVSYSLLDENLSSSNDDDDDDGKQLWKVKGLVRRLLMRRRLLIMHNQKVNMLKFLSSDL